MTIDHRRFTRTLIPALLTVCLAFAGCKTNEGGIEKAATSPPQTAATVQVDSAVLNGDISVVLCRPTTTTMTANIVTAAPSSVYAAWQTGAGEKKSAVYACSTVQPAIITMDGHTPGGQSTYRVFYKAVGDTEYRSTEAATFSMPKTAGTAFSFAVQSDSHILNKADPVLLTQSMQTIASYHPDFLVDMGDTFLNDQTKTDPQYQEKETIRRTYLQGRQYFGIVARSSPLYLAIGNHEGEYGYYLDGTEKGIAAMAAGLRKLYYPNPIPNEFYTGNTQKDSVVGLPEDYYAYTWGDALFVVIDPYRYSTMDPRNDKDGWQWSLGEVQYRWFRQTLETSKAKYKFVFAHHAIGNMRGGAIVANLYEWGGYDKKGAYLFDQKRPGWGKPVHAVMKDAGVTIFFQGHDHLFSREDVDGVVYQTLPKPAEKTPDQQSNFQSYTVGDTLLNSGFLIVSVDADSVRVDYYRNYFVSSNPQQGNTGIVYSYTVDANGNVNVLKTTKDDLSTYSAAPAVTDGKKKK